MPFEQVVTTIPPPESFTDDYALGIVNISLSYELPFAVSRLHIASSGPLLIDFGEAGYAGEGNVGAEEAYSCNHNFTLNIAYAPARSDEVIESLLSIEAEVTDCKALQSS